MFFKIWVMMIQKFVQTHVDVFSRIQAYLRLGPLLPTKSIFLPRGWKSIAVGLYTGCTAYRPFFWSGDKTRPKKWKKKLGSSRTDCCFTATVTQLRGGRQLRQGQHSGSTGLPAKNSSDEETPVVTRPALVPASWLPALAKTTLAATAAVPPPLLRSSSGVCRVAGKEGWRSAHWRVGLTWASWTTSS